MCKNHIHFQKKNVLNKNFMSKFILIEGPIHEVKHANATFALECLGSPYYGGLELSLALERCNQAGTQIKLDSIFLVVI